MHIRNIYERGSRVQVAFPAAEGRARQEMAMECDINNIMSKYQKSGAIDHFAAHSGSYGDVDAVDYHSAMNIVVKANQMFADLPSKLRKELGDDPAAFLEFVRDEANLESLEAHGLLKEGNSVAVAREAAEVAAKAVLAAPEAPSEPSLEPPAEAPGTVPT